MSQESVTLEAPPRTVQLKSFLSVWRFWIFHLSFIGFYTFISINYLPNKAIPFWAYYFGVSSEATITQKWSLDTGYGHRSIYPTLTVQFENGSRAADLRVSHGTYRQVHAGDKLNLHYFSWAVPSLSADMDHPTGIGLWFMLGYQLLFVLLVPWDMFLILMSTRKQKRLLMKGQTVTAIIQKRSRNLYHYAFEWENQVWKGVLRSSDLLYGAYDSNDLLVLFDSEKPKTNLAYVPQQWIWGIVQPGQKRI